MQYMPYSPSFPPWKRENRLPTLKEIQELDGWLNLAEDPTELEYIGQAAIEAALELRKFINENQAFSKLF